MEGAHRWTGCSCLRDVTRDIEGAAWRAALEVSETVGVDIESDRLAARCVSCAGKAWGNERSCDDASTDQPILE